jgi:hypothetical protein
MSKFKTNEEYFQYAKTLSVIPTEDLVRLLQNYKLRFPLQVHRFVLKETLYSKVFQTQLYNTYTDELKYRLRGYQDYSLFLLEKLHEDFNLDFDAAKYKEVFFNVLFLNRDLYGLKDNFFTDLEKLKYKYAVDYEKISYAAFMTYLLPLLYEAPSFLDGVSLRILKEVLVHSCTLGDLRGLGEKYNVKVPRRINKVQLIEILASRFRLTEEESLLLGNKSVLELEIYAKEKGFKISIDLKKTDMVEYILFAKDMFHIEHIKDQHNYNVPRSEDIDSVKIDEQHFVVFKEDDVSSASILNEEDDSTPSVVEPIKPILRIVEPIQVIKEEVKKTEVLVEKLPESIKDEPQKVIHVEEKEEVIKHVEPVKEEIVEEIIQVVKEETVLIAPSKEEIKKATKEKKKEVEPLVEVETLDVSKDFTNEEQALLDEKIEQIIKRYKKSRRSKAFWTTIFFIIGLSIVGFVGYVLYYHFVLDIGNWPFI